MRVQLAQINTTVGDLEGNAARVLQALDIGRAHGAELAIFPELTITGYPPRDLLENRTFISDNVRTLERVARSAQGIAAIVGYAMPNETGAGKALFNAAALCADGRVLRRTAKRLLPTYDVFDEDRHFEPAKDAALVDLGGCKIGVSVCEDAWNDPEFWGRRFYEHDPIGEQVAMGAGLLVNISASPFALGRPGVREALLRGHASRRARPLVFVNLVGGNDEILFDGRSCLFDASGRKIAQLAAFREDTLIVDIEDPGREAGALAPSGSVGGRIPSLETESAPSGTAARPRSEADGEERGTLTGAIRIRPDGGAEGASAGSRVGGPGEGSPARADAEEAFEALVMGTRDYASKCGFAHAVLGLSGGIDSSVVAAIAAEALGPRAVTGVSMPSRYSSQGSLVDAAALAANLGIGYRTVPIEAIHAQYLETLAPVLGARAGGVAEENIQARIRGNLLMALSNTFGWLVLTTGNKSEMAVGYSTLYGDMSGGLAVIADVPKTLVYEIGRHVNRRREVIPDAVFTKPPSAELRPDQTDQDTLPPYQVLDGILRLYIEEMRPVREIVAEGYEEETVRDVVRRVRRSEYKRHQAPPGLRITTKAFGLGRRMPIAERYMEPFR